MRLMIGEKISFVHRSFGGFGLIPGRIASTNKWYVYESGSGTILTGTWYDDEWGNGRFPSG